MSRARSVYLRDVVSIERDSVAPDAIEDGTVLIGLEHIDSSGQFVGLEQSKAETPKSTKFRFDQRHVLYGKLRPYLRKVARPTFSGICSTGILPLLPTERIDRDYLYHWLRS